METRALLWIVPRPFSVTGEWEPLGKEAGFQGYTKYVVFI